MKIKYTFKEKLQQIKDNKQKIAMQQYENFLISRKEALGKPYEKQEYQSIYYLQEEYLKQRKNWQEFATLDLNLTYDSIINEYIKKLKASNDVDKDYLNYVINSRHSHEVTFGYYPLICQDVYHESGKGERGPDIKCYERYKRGNSKIVNNHKFEKYYKATYKSSKIEFSAPSKDSLILIDDFAKNILNQASDQQYSWDSPYLDKYEYDRTLARIVGERGEKYPFRQLTVGWDAQIARPKTTVLFIPTFELKINYNNGTEDLTVYYTENFCGKIIKQPKHLKV